MRKSLLDILACPEDKSKLQLSATEESGDEIIAGVLTCTECGFDYPIEEGIPNLLPQSMHVDDVKDAA